MRKTKIIIYLSIAFVLLVGIFFLSGYRLSPIAVSRELDTKAHFTPSEVVSQSTVNGVATVITRHGSWIQCHVINKSFGIMWKANSIQPSPIDLSNPVIPQSEEGLIAAYLDACQWIKYKIDPVIILQEALEIVKPYLGEDGVILSHKIIRIVEKPGETLQVDSTLVFTSGDNTVTSNYTVYFYKEPDWPVYYSRLIIKNISVQAAVSVREYFDWRYLNILFDPYQESILSGKLSFTSETFKDVVLDLEHGKMAFTAVLSGENLGWTYVYEERVKAVYDLYKGWMYSISDQSFHEIMEVSGSWKVDLYDVREGPGAEVYITTIKNLIIKGQLELQFSADNEIVEPYTNTIIVKFDLMGKHYEGPVDFSARPLITTLSFILDPETEEMILFSFGISDKNFHVHVYVAYGSYYGRSISLE